MSDFIATFGTGFSTLGEVCSTADTFATFLLQFYLVFDSTFEIITFGFFHGFESSLLGIILVEEVYTTSKNDTDNNGHYPGFQFEDITDDKGENYEENR